MKRLTTDKPVSDMNMVELAHNSCFAKDGEAYYRDFDGEISARDFARKLYKIYSGDKLSADNDVFDEEIMDELQYDPEIYSEGFIALFYRNIWAMADLREELKRYEDLGTVEELKQAIERQTPKQIITKVQAEDLKIGHITFKAGTKTYWCSCCKLPVTLAGSFCPSCGQAFKLD